ncbi:MAG: glucose 1-dehydrogenase [Vicinamibacterales bacterium]
MSFTAKAIIVTGATSGIGRRVALRFVSDGANVVGVGRDAQALAEVAGACEGPGTFKACAADITDTDAARRVVAFAIGAHGRLDVLVNAAGLIATGSIENTSDETWDKVMALNVEAPFRLMRAAVPHLLETKGCIVNVSSVNGMRVFPNVLAYNVSKAALDHLTRCAAIELAPKGVRVNAVNPGVTVTNLHRRSGYSEEQYAAFLERSKETHPLGRPGNPDDIAEAVLFLASEKNSWITGETMPVDGGRHLTCAR